MAYSTKLSKLLSLVLRHRPDILNLSLDQEGWADVNELLNALQAHPGFRWVTQDDLLTVVHQSNKKRLQVQDSRIRAVYGHSLKETIQYRPAAPPPVLYHGTTTKAAASIQKEGLRPMNRQYVHYSASVELAKLVGGRRARRPVILLIDAAGAHAAGHAFFKVDDDVWLSHAIPPDFIHLPDATESQE